MGTLTVMRIVCCVTAIDVKSRRRQLDVHELLTRRHEWRTYVCRWSKVSGSSDWAACAAAIRFLKPALLGCGPLSCSHRRRLQ